MDRNDPAHASYNNNFPLKDAKTNKKSIKIGYKIGPRKFLDKIIKHYLIEPEIVFISVPPSPNKNKAYSL